MKKIKKIICLALAAIMALSVCVMLASCGEEQKGELLASYSGGDIYEKEVLDWQSFFLMENVKEISQAEDPQAKIAEVNDRATEFYVQLKAFRKLLEDKGIATLTDETIKKYADEVLRPALDDAYPDAGGYAFWLKSYNVSENFLYDYAEEQLVTAYLEKYVMDNYGVTEDMIYEYWESHAYKYLIVPSYKFDVIMVTVADSDKANAEAWEAAKVEAEGYIERLRSGEDFDKVKEDAIKNSKNEKSATTYSVSDSVPITECIGFEDEKENLDGIDEYIKELEKTNKSKLVEYADPKGDSTEYTLWFLYCNMLNEYYTKHALLNLKDGEICAEPIRHLEGYEIIRMNEKSDETEFQNPKTNTEVYNDIYETLYNQIWDEGEGSAVQEFEAKLKEDYGIVIHYSYASNYSAQG